MLKAINSDKAPAAIGPYVQAIVSGETIYCSGCLSMDAQGNFIPGDAAAQAQRALENLAHILEAAGASLQSVVKTTVFLTDMDDFAAVNAVYAQAFGDHRPARSCVAVAALPRGGNVEIEAIALAKA